MGDLKGPGHRDRARPLRVSLAMLAGDMTDIATIAAEARDDRDVDLFFVASVGCFVTALRQLHPDPVGHIQDWLAWELDQPDPERGDDESIVPSHQERARALRAVLAALTDNFDAVLAAAHEVDTARGVDRLLLAICDLLGMFIAQHTDAFTYLQDRIAVELALADAEESGPR